MDPGRLLPLRRLALDLFDDPIMVSVRIGRRVSVDGHRPDDALDFAARAFGHAPAHRSTAEAVNNVESPRLLLRRVGLVGHGAEGFLSTGCGASGAMTPDNCMSHVNEADWDPDLQRLRGMANTVFLIGCSTGKGQAGRALLRAVACSAEATAVAPTRALYVLPDGEIWVHHGGEWQYVRCDGSSFRRPAGMLRGLRRRLFRTPLEGHPLARGAASLILRYDPAPGSRAGARTFEGPEAAEVLALIDRVPEELPVEAVPLAVPTGRLDVIALDHGDEIHHTFTVLGGSLLRDDDHPSRFYETDERFLERIGGWDAVVGPLLAHRRSQPV
jgi:hypothetical protein